MEMVVSPIPSAPYVFEPQHQTVPSAFTAQVKNGLFETLAARKSVAFVFVTGVPLM
jgi:hypothetical protein